MDPFDPVDRVPGLGPAARAVLADHGIRTVLDLIWTAPVGFVDLRKPLELHEAIARGAEDPKARLTFAAIVDSAGMMFVGRRRGVRVVLRDAADPTCKLHAFWFFYARGVLGLAKPGTALLVTGRIKVEPKKPARSAHPDLQTDGPGARTVHARYPKLGIAGSVLRKSVAAAVSTLVGPGGLGGEGEGDQRTDGDQKTHELDPIPPDVRRREGLRSAGEVLRAAHGLTGELPDEATREAFAARPMWAQAFARALLRRQSAEASRFPAVPLPRAKVAELASLEKALGFALTAGQRAAIAEVAADLTRPIPMRRLLLGDVGTGKTAVALAAVAQCLAAGRQAAIFAPTSVLADQYLAAVEPLRRLFPDLRVAFVVGDVPAAERRETERLVAKGEARLAIGTHALLEEGVAFHDLALVVVDEQQRLGVDQRLAMVRKGTHGARGDEDGKTKRPHVLTLTATPIPRTLALALRGEIATSSLDERPAARGPIATRLAPAGKLAPILREVEARLDRNERVFWIVPRVASDEDDDDDDTPEDGGMATVTKRAATLAKRLPKHAGAVGMLHARLKPADKRAAMHGFRAGTTPLLVATTVVEVGVDVPEATLVVIEGAERFGLAQLHQLRGRVGRGAIAGTCVLLHGEPLDSIARRRLEALARFATGEEVARVDLELRGAGDPSGTRQHGDDPFAWLTLGESAPAWVARIEEDATELAARDPDLARAEHAALRAFVARFTTSMAIREEGG